MKFIITQKVYKENEKHELALISTYKRTHKSIVHANFDAKDMADKLKQRKSIDFWSVEIHDEDGDLYTTISPTVGDQCTPLFIGMIITELNMINKVIMQMGLDVVEKILEN